MAPTPSYRLVGMEKVMAKGEETRERILTAAEPLVLRQVFATCMAARYVAASPKLREEFGKKAGLIEQENATTFEERSR